MIIEREQGLILQSTFAKILNKFRNICHVKDFPKTGRKSIPEAKKVDVLFDFQEDPHNSTKQVAVKNNLHYATIL